jgi:hypothetical protein
MPLLMDHPCCVVSLDAARGILRFTRTEVAYASLQDVVGVHQRIGQAFDRLGRERHRLLVDMRRATLNNKPEFEQAAARARAILVRGFPRVAVMVQTAVGALQVGRHLREDGVPGEVFTDEEQALEYLCRVETEPVPPSGVSSSRSSRDGPFANLTRSRERAPTPRDRARR